ncbi:hypothetical protein GCM10010361_33490 [Streptomyces olivaceiscleroticus]|uniref:Uncharacterized protein n=1 Tax=Streptomyces olivaceiscleroticus TaxID=68245 RepID=A0ABP3JZ77_9ACTN
MLALILHIPVHRALQRDSAAEEWRVAVEGLADAVASWRDTATWPAVVLTQGPECALRNGRADRRNWPALFCVTVAESRHDGWERCGAVVRCAGSGKFFRPHATTSGKGMTGLRRGFRERGMDMR